MEEESLHVKSGSSKKQHILEENFSKSSQEYYDEEEQEYEHDHESSESLKHNPESSELQQDKLWQESSIDELQLKMEEVMNILRSFSFKPVYDSFVTNDTTHIDKNIEKD